MTKKDYVLIAEALKEAADDMREFNRCSPEWNECCEYEKKLTFNNTYHCIANAFEKDNPKFDRKKFYEAVFTPPALRKK